MDAPLRHRPTSPAAAAAAVSATEEIPPGPSIDAPQPAVATEKRNNKKKKQKTLDSDTASSASSNNCSCTTSSSEKCFKISRNPKGIRVGPLRTATARRNVGPSDVDALGLPLGMAIAAFVAQVLEKKDAAGGSMSVDYLSRICILAVRESLLNVFGDRFDNFVTNFEKSFQSTLMTLRLISCSSQTVVGKQVRRARFRGCSFSAANNSLSRDNLKNPALDISGVVGPHSSLDRIEDFASSPNSADDLVNIENHTSTMGTNLVNRVVFHGIENGQQLECSSSASTRNHTSSTMGTNLVNRELVLHGIENGQQLECSSSANTNLCLSNSGLNQVSMLSSIEKSVIEQTRSNDLKTFEIGLIMKKLQLKERELELNSSANLLERWKLSMGFSKASFKAEKFKTQLQDSRQVELLKRCLDFLVAGLIIMLFSLGYGTYVYSRRRIIEATEACSPYTEPKSWWMLKSMFTINSTLKLLNCRIQVLSRMLFGVLMIAAIAFLLIQRSSASHQTMPVTIILLLLGGLCGYAGKFCVDTLGGNGNHWLMYWEAICLLHFVSNVFHSWLFIILNGPITVAEGAEHSTVFPYWMRKLIFFAMLLFLPLFCGFMPFAGPLEWFDHFSSRGLDFLTLVDVESS